MGGHEHGGGNDLSEGGNSIQYRVFDKSICIFYVHLLHKHFCVVLQMDRVDLSRLSTSKRRAPSAAPCSPLDENTKEVS